MLRFSYKTDERADSTVQVNSAALCRGANLLAYLSFFGTNGEVREAIRSLSNKLSKDAMTLSGFGSFLIQNKLDYEFIQGRAQSDFVHAIMVLKSRTVQEDIHRIVLYRQGFMKNTELLMTAENMRQLMSDDRVDDWFPVEVLDVFYSQVAALSSVPVMREWSQTLLEELLLRGFYQFCAVREFDAIAPSRMGVLVLEFKSADLLHIVKTCLANKKISMGDGVTGSDMSEVSSLDGYLAQYASRLSERIQEGFRPSFVPEEDAYSQNLEMFSDYVTYNTHGKVKLYDAQKAVIQAISNHLQEKDMCLLVGEMGAGSISMFC